MRNDSFLIGSVLHKTYVQASPTFNIARHSFQIIRVPQNANLRLGGQLNAAAWDGLNGGLIAVDVAKNTNFAGQIIYAAAQGFRGAGGRASVVNGKNPFRDNDTPGVSHAGKAEGIAGTPPFLFTNMARRLIAKVIRARWRSMLALCTGYPGTQLNQATITAPIGTIDPLPANNLAQATVTILVSTSLGITKTNAVSKLTAGQTTSYAITAFNDGSAAADGSIVRDPVSAGLG